MKERFQYRNGWPRRGWVLLGTTDNEAADFTCENCGYPRVRFEHELRNQKPVSGQKLGVSARNT